MPSQRKFVEQCSSKAAEQKSLPLLSIKSPSIFHSMKNRPQIRAPRIQSEIKTIGAAEQSATDAYFAGMDAVDRIHVKAVCPATATRNAKIEPTPLDRVAAARTSPAPLPAGQLTRRSATLKPPKAATNEGQTPHGQPPTLAQCIVFRRTLEVQNCRCTSQLSEFRMSALGHERTFGLVRVMSALPSKADILSGVLEHCPLSARSRHRARRLNALTGHHGRSTELVTCSRSGEVKHRPTHR